MELIAYVIGLFLRELFSLPAPIVLIGIVLLVAGAIYQSGWNAAVDADWHEDRARADARRSARRK